MKAKQPVPASRSCASLHQKVARLVFSGKLVPGARLVERDLARDLGLSRIPIREALMKLVAKGVLVRDEAGGGIRMRTYSAEEVRQLYEVREAIEVAAGRAACRKATEAEVLAMDVISEHMEGEIGNYGSDRWANLDRMFHETMFASSHNDRFIKDFDLLIRECHYVFYLHPARHARPNPSKAWIRDHMTEVLEVHRAITDAIRNRNEEDVQKAIRKHMNDSVTNATRFIVSANLNDSMVSG